MPPAKVERVERQVLLSDKDQANASIIIEGGFAQNVSQAIRVGLAFGAKMVIAPMVTPSTP